MYLFSCTYHPSVLEGTQAFPWGHASEKFATQCFHLCSRSPCTLRSWKYRSCLATFGWYAQRKSSHHLRNVATFLESRYIGRTRGPESHFWRHVAKWSSNWWCLSKRCHVCCRCGGDIWTAAKIQSYWWLAVQECPRILFDASQADGWNKWIYTADIYPTERGHMKNVLSMELAFPDHHVYSVSWRILHVKVQFRSPTLSLLDFKISFWAQPQNATKVAQNWGWLVRAHVCVCVWLMTLLCAMCNTDRTKNLCVHRTIS